MNLTEALWMPLLAGVLSTLIASAITAAFRARPARDQPAPVVAFDNIGGDKVFGDKVFGDKVLSETHEHHEHHHHYPQKSRAVPNRSSATDDDSDVWGPLIVAVVVLVVAVLAFLLVWPYVLGLMIGAGIVLVLAAAGLTGRTRGCAACRKRLRSLWFNTAVGVVAGVITWWFVLQSRSDGQGLRGALDKVARTYPTFDDGVSGRWVVLTRHGPDIASLLGSHSVLLIGLHLLAIAAVVGIALFASQDALALVTAHRESGLPTPARGVAQTFATVLLAGLAFALVCGPVESLLDQQFPVSSTTRSHTNLR